jgi:hypothetical protein
MYTVALTADYAAPQGRIVTDHVTAEVPNLPAALQLTDARWQAVGRRRGSTLHARYTAPDGQTIVRTLRRE